MSRPALMSGPLADRFRLWVRSNPSRFQAYTRLRKALHWLQWLPFHGVKATRRGWNVAYWMPYKLRPSLWSGTRYATRAAAGFPPAPVPLWMRKAVAGLMRMSLGRMGDFTPIRHVEASHLAERTQVLVAAQELHYAAPRVFGSPPAGWPAPWPDLRIPKAAITAAQWKDATVVGKFDTVLVGTHAVVGDLWQPDTERTFDEVRDYALFEPPRITYYRRRGHGPRHIERAIVVVGGPTGNWAHWTTEYLPKVALADTLEEYGDWPLVIDETLHPNIVASLELVGRKRELVRLPEGAPLRVAHALTIGSPGYTAYEYRYDPADGPPRFGREHTVFSPAAMDLVRQRAWASTGARPGRERLLYITRPKGSMRPFVGGEEVEQFFAAQGFELVDTGGMSAADQVRLFAQARCIAGPSGAGLANLVFAPPGCRVLVFTSNSPHSIFHYFANMGAATGHSVYYCYGESIYERDGHPGHAGFSVPLEDARRMWQAVTEDEPGIAG